MSSEPLREDEVRDLVQDLSDIKHTTDATLIHYLNTQRLERPTWFNRLIEQDIPYGDAGLGITLLLGCALFGRRDVLVQLLDWGVIDRTTREGLNALLYTLNNNDRTLFELLVNENNKYQECYMHLPPLSLACLQGHVDLVEHLLQNCRCDPNHRNTKQETVLHHLCFFRVSSFYCHAYETQRQHCLQLLRSWGLRMDPDHVLCIVKAEDTALIAEVLKDRVAIPLPHLSLILCLSVQQDHERLFLYALQQLTEQVLPSQREQYLHQTLTYILTEGRGARMLKHLVFHKHFSDLVAQTYWRTLFLKHVRVHRQTFYLQLLVARGGYDFSTEPTLPWSTHSRHLMELLYENRETQRLLREKLEVWQQTQLPEEIPDDLYQLVTTYTVPT